MLFANRINGSVGILVLLVQGLVFPLVSRRRSVILGHLHLRLHLHRLAGIQNTLRMRLRQNLMGQIRYVPGLGIDLRPGIERGQGLALVDYLLISQHIGGRTWHLYYRGDRRFLRGAHEIRRLVGAVRALRDTVANVVYGYAVSGRTTLVLISAASWLDRCCWRSHCHFCHLRDHSLDRRFRESVIRRDLVAFPKGF